MAEGRVAQGHYLKAIRRLTEESVKLCPNRWWPQLFLCGYRANHVGRVAPDVDPGEVRDLFEKYLPDQLFEKLLQHAEEGQHAYTYAPRWRQRAKTAPSALQHINEVWRTAWVDTSLARTFTWPPDCMTYMDLAEISCYPLSRVPKCSTATGLPTGKGRLIADLSWEGDDGWSINSLTMLSVYGSFNMLRHADIARSVLSLAYWFPLVQLVMCKEDVSGAFRRK